MDNVVRLVVVCALIAYGIFRIIRYFRYGMARRVTAVPSASGVLPMPGTAARSDLSAGMQPDVPTGRLVKLQAAAVSVLLFVAANGVLLAALFGLPMLGNVPVIWRLFVAVFANFYLLPFARAVGEKQLKRAQARGAENGNPFGH